MPGLERRAGEPPTAAALGRGSMEKGAGGAANGVEGEGVRDWIWDTCLYMMHVLCGPLAGRPANFVPGRAICHAGVAARPHSGMVYGSCQPGHGDKRAVPCCAWPGQNTVLFRRAAVLRAIWPSMGRVGSGCPSLPCVMLCTANPYIPMRQVLRTQQTFLIFAPTFKFFWRAFFYAQKANRVAIN